MDKSGCRYSPAFPDSKQLSCVAIYGDSYTYGLEVDNEAAWGNLLATQLNCRVANYGVSGYGTDQSYLRYLKYPVDSGKIVILNHLSADILRNINQYRDFIYPAGGVGFKPRFSLKADTLRLIPMPTILPNQWGSFLNQPADFIQDDYFIPGGGAGNQILSFPYTVNLIQVFNHIYIKSKLVEFFEGTNHQPYFDFYSLEHPSKAVELTSGIMKAFQEEALQNQQHPILTIFPTHADISYFQTTGNWIYQPLIDELAKNDLEVLNFGSLMLAKMPDMDVCDYFTNCKGHYTEKGNKLVAEIFYTHLESL